MTVSIPQKPRIACLIGFGIAMVLLLLVSGCTQQGGSPPTTTVPTATQTTAGLPNPASVSCGQAGGNVDIKKDASGNEYGMCTFKNGTSCEEWALFRNEGCKPAIVSTPTGTEGKKMFTFTSSDNKGRGDITQNTRFAVVLEENPTTGFTWNATLSPGLELQTSDYRQDNAAPGMVGVGGTRTWVIVAKDLGDQKFSALYRRSWENITGNESEYTVTINVVKA
jgi:predicted secreted protein/putative hemolysin